MDFEKNFIVFILKNTNYLKRKNIFLLVYDYTLMHKYISHLTLENVLKGKLLMTHYSQAILRT